MIEIYLLEALKIFRDCKTLSATAEYLHISEPSVSRAMKKLEENLGVSLFERQKNKITLNETGMLAADYAQKILDSEDEMISHLREFDRSRHSIIIGSCAPGPIMELLPLVTGLYGDFPVSSEQEEEGDLIEGLMSGKFNLILLTHPIEGAYCHEYGSERLYLTISHFHPAAIKKEISFSEMNGQSFIMFSKVGFWEEVVREKMPDSKIIKQDDMEALGELVESSDLPGFSTDITQRVFSSYENGRIDIPFSDKEAFVKYYLICLKKDKNRYRRLFDSISS